MCTCIYVIQKCIYMCVYFIKQKQLGSNIIKAAKWNESYMLLLAYLYFQTFYSEHVVLRKS